ncbi:protein EMBRYONIC FLOWER 1-like [Durio zibethinus]|uniref:Protein EMBRYONIC FLOWER 1-like n=1 Tax=Durio zibethinus TaxID=66656 RepID=A0A6P5ZQB8_DURZI|nr:protein EMBRYONIC FLOWER 1-like [Durio zibethinus]XP_022754589.1 protein EMBRYONIC FLOWER 1-like [Durio zibethinus]XP_022754590.1 protein EMBRYONIC FLOWER 1-like [Durio zibethinus]
METTIAVKETHQSCSSNLVAKSVESPIRIGSISIDLNNANDDIDTGKCEHFSIRGYASEMRNKDWKKCWPFALDGGQNISEEQNYKLPPLLVPKFRWWCCHSCLQDIGAEGSMNEERTVANNSSKLKSFGSCSNVSSHGDAVTWLSDLQQAGKINVESRKHHDSNASLNVGSNECHPLFSDRSEKKAEIADIPIIGQTYVLENNINPEIHISNYAGIEVISSLMQQSLRIDDKVASQLHQKVNLKDDEVDGVKLPESNPKCMVKDATETRQAGKHASACDQQMELVKARGSYGITSMVNRVPDAIKTCTAEHPSLELDDCDYASSERAEILLGIGSGSLHRRKTRKVRLLAELLGKNGDEKPDLTSMEDSPSTAIPDASVGIDSMSAPEGQANCQGNVTSSLAHSRKRKLPQDEEWRPGEMSSPNNGHQNLRTFNRVAETADGIASSDSEGTANRSSSQAPVKRHLANFKVDKSPILGKKKNKKAQNFDGCLSLSLSGENLQKERQKKPTDTTKSNATDIILYKSNDVSTGSGLDPFPESAQKAEKKSNLLKKKSKMHHDHDGHVSPIPWNNGILREGLTSRKDAGVRQNGSIAVPLEVTQDASAEKGLHFSLNNFLPAKRYDAKNISPIRDGLPCLLPWQGCFLSEYEVGRKDLNMNFVGESSFPSKSELDASLWKGMHVDLNSNQTTYRIPFLNEKQKQRSHAEVGNCSLIQQMDFSGTSNNGKTVEVQDHSTVARKHYDLQAEMASEEGALDDIPMEIVELMAKNQYERFLPDTETEKHPSETTNNTRNHQRVDLNKVYRNEEVSLFHETTDKPKPRAKYERIGKIVSGDNVGPSRQKSVDYFSHMDQNQYNMSQLEQSYSPPGFRHFPLCGEKPLHGIQFCATNSSRQNSAQNCQWIGNMVGQRSSHTSMQAWGVCNTCQSASQQNREAAHLWSSMIPNNMPYLCSIPQKCADQVAKVDVLSHCPGSLPKRNTSGNDGRNFLDLASNFEKHSGKFDSGVLRRTHADYPFTCKHNGSLDQYPNEIMPAMHLLSLMDAGLQSGTPVDVDGDHTFVKKTSFLHGHHSKEFSSLPSGRYRSNSMKHPSYDCYGKSHLPESFCECTSATPAVGPSTSSFQHDKSFKKATDFKGQFSLKSREKGKKKCSDSQTQNRYRRSQKTVSSSSGLNTTCGSIPVHSMPKSVLGTSDFTMFPIQLHVIQGATKQKWESRTMSGSPFHPKSGSENEICCINRNPADFTVPEAGNIYMIRGEDLKFGREAPSSGLMKLVGHKRQRKLTVRKEHSRNQTL